MTLAGCGVRSIEYGNGIKVTELFFGPPTTVSCESGRTVSGTIRSAGVFGTADSGGFGFSEQMFLCGYGECHLAVWPNATADLTQVIKRVEEINQDCINALEANL